MGTPALSVQPADVDGTDAPILVVGVRQVEKAPVLALPRSVSAAAVGLDGVDLASLGMRGATGDLIRLPGADGRVTVLIGLGSGDATPDALRAAAGTITRRIRPATTIGFVLDVADSADAAAVLEGAALGAHAFTDYRSTTKDAQKPAATSVVLLTDVEVPDVLVRRAGALADAVGLVKRLVATPPNDLFPEALAVAAVDAAVAVGATAEVWDEERLAVEGCGGILGVGGGSARPPRLVKVVWSPAGAAKHVALVGKGITFDSGGLSLKPPTSMVGMKYDMAGAATVLGAVCAAAALALPVAVTAWLCIAENMPSGAALRPNDVIRLRGGTTVEVLNTDAEGRLVLGDGLALASEEHPDAIVDVATLTGAQIVALGNRTTGAMGDAGLVEAVEAAAVIAGEQVWHMPLPEELRALLNSEIADIANVKPGNTAGGMLIAAEFLREFVGTTADGGARIPWVHLDIAGPAEHKGGGYGFTGTGPTGAMTRTLVALIERFA